MKPSWTVLGFKNMTNTAISSELSPKVFSPLFIQIVRIPMTLGCNPMVEMMGQLIPFYVKFGSNTNTRLEHTASDGQFLSPRNSATMRNSESVLHQTG